MFEVRNPPILKERQRGEKKKIAKSLSFSTAFDQSGV